jgi:hypothetical protein
MFRPYILPQYQSKTLHLERNKANLSTIYSIATKHSKLIHTQNTRNGGVNDSNSNQSELNKNKSKELIQENVEQLNPKYKTIKMQVNNNKETTKPTARTNQSSIQH